MRYLYYFCVFLLFSCNKNSSKIEKQERIMNYDFDTNLDISTTSVELEEILDIQDWYIRDSLLICKNSLGSPFYYSFNLSNFQFNSSFGQKGNGPTEWISPQLVVGRNNLFVIDNQTKYLYKIDSVISKMGKCKELFAINYLQTCNYPICSYLTYSPKETLIKLYDVEKDSIMNETILANNDYKERFAYNVNSKFLVTAYNRIERIVIYTTENNYKLSPSIILNGTLNESPGKYYYSDVVCDENFFYLLSQKNVDFTNINGYSHIEVYDYSGNNIALLKLDIFAKRMLLDEKNNRFVFLSQMDDNIHIGKIPTLKK